MLTGVLQAHRRFAGPALAPLLSSVVVASAYLLFAWMASLGHDLTALIVVVSADNLAGGIASAAFIAYLSSLTNIQYSATQYALFSSLMLLLPKFIAGFSGAYVDAFGYTAADLRWFTVNAMKSAFLPFDERLAVIEERIKPVYAGLGG